jgi:hypothetical protein
VARVDGFAEKLDEGRVDAWIGDAAGRKKKLQAASHSLISPKTLANRDSGGRANSSAGSQIQPLFFRRHSGTLAQATIWRAVSLMQVKKGWGLREVEGAQLTKGTLCAPSLSERKMLKRSLEGRNCIDSVQVDESLMAHRVADRARSLADLRDQRPLKLLSDEPQMRFRL